MSLATLGLLASSAFAPAQAIAPTQVRAPAQVYAPAPTSVVAVGFRPARFNFQSESAAVPRGYFKDFGEPFGRRLGPQQGNGLVYGWSAPGSGAPFDLVGRGRQRGASPDPRLDTLMHTGPAGGGPDDLGVWELAVPRGDYTVRVVCGDPSFFNSAHRVVVEGLIALDGAIADAGAPHVTAEVVVAVRDGRLSLEFSGGENTKLSYVEVVRKGVATPQVAAVTPRDGSVGVDLDGFIATDVYLPNVGLDASTVTARNVLLYPAATPGSLIQAVVNTTGGGDAIVLDPLGMLEPQTDYVFEVTDDVRDLAGARLIPFTSTFRTVSNSAGQVVDLEFERETVATGSRYTSLEVGPDRRLYALVDDGEIHRYSIEDDGTLSGFEQILSLVAAEGEARLAVGLTHDPASTASDPVVWVSHSSFGFNDMPDWGGRISRLSGPALGTVQRAVEGLPRSTRDHVTNSLRFGPDGALYFAQGGNNAMGAPDSTWGMRPERLLSAAVLRLDTSTLGAATLDARTAEGGTYDPYAPGAPLTVYATGIRNGYDLVWHSNGSLYVPGNSSASGGNAPASPDPLPAACAGRPDGPYLGPGVPGINGVSQTLDDFLMRVEAGGYYGHPNPSRCEWVLNGGNPTLFVDALEIPQYPVGTLPDPAFRGFAYDFGNNRSPNGALEYSAGRFGGSLAGSLIVARYSGGDDLMVLRPSADGSVPVGLASIETFDGLNDPLDVAEDPLNGNLYVSEYGGASLTLLRPVDGTLPGVSVAPSEAVFSAVAGAVGGTVSISVTNDRATTVRIESSEILGHSAFLLSTGPALPLDLAPGASAAFDVQFAPDSASVGSLEGQLRLTLDAGVSETALFGLSAATFAGAGEAPLARIVDTLGISVDVGGDQLALGTDPAPLGDEVSAPLFVKAGPGQVTLQPVARYSPDYALPFGYYLPDGANTVPIVVGTLADSSAQDEHQRLFPPLASGVTAFDPGGAPFGCFTTSPTHSVFTEDLLNELLFPGYVAHGVRVYPFVDRRGLPHPDAWLIGFEEATNGDYQDYVFVLRNARPVE